MTRDPNAKYWKDYDGLQYVKHQLLEKYLGAWFPILSTWHGRVLYVDCNAGRGRHGTGQEGSPILALQTLLNHQSRNRILSSTQVNFVFFENNSYNYQQLQTEIQALGTLPNNIVVSPYEKDYESTLRRLIQGLHTNSKQLAPSFIFVDPFGFQLSMALLNSLLDFSRCELFINLMYRYVDLAINNPSQSNHMDNLFGTTGWRQLPKIEDPWLRAERTLDLFADQLNAQYVTRMYMLGKNNTIKYVLFHATNHSLGRERIKDAMWAVIPDGTFVASERRNPHQLVLLEPKPDLSALKDNLWANFAGHDIDVNRLYSWLLTELYRKPHLHEVLTEYRKRGIVTFNGTNKRVAFSHNPIITFPSKRPNIN